MLINLKGGVAKTTSAVAIAECLASAGHRTLLIDADHQCMAGELLLGENGQATAERRKQTLHDLLAAMLQDDFTPRCFPAFVRGNASDIGSGLSKLSVLPCSYRIDDFISNMAKARKGYKTTSEFLRTFDSRKRQLRKWLMTNYDFTIIDCPPSLAIQVKILLSVADRYIVPSIPDQLSVRGSLFLLDRIKKRGFKISGLGTLWSLYRQQNPLHCKFVEQAKKSSPPFDQLPKPFETIIPNAAKIAGATEPGQKPRTFRQKYSLEFAKLFEALCGEMVRRVELEPGTIRDKALVN
jgi:chromosome partitioning protein